MKVSPWLFFVEDLIERTAKKTGLGGQSHDVIGNGPAAMAGKQALRDDWRVLELIKRTPARILSDPGPRRANLNYALSASGLIGILL